MKKTSGQKIFDWIDERFQIKALIDFAKHKSVPVYRGSIWYYFGGISLFLFIVQVLTGMLLLMYYKGDAGSAYESVQFITAKVHFGWLIRSLHSWSANLMVFSIFVHMFSVFFTKGYRKPRELSWYSGMLLLFMALAFGFSGYLLPWNELAFFATKVGTDIMGILPVIGKPMLILMRGGEDVSGATLSRFFGFHVALFPGIFTVILSIHLLMIQRQGISEPESWKRLPVEKKFMPFFPNFAYRDLIVWLIVLNVLALLAVFFPWELGKKADPFGSAPAGIRPEWYFMFMFQTLKFIPAKILAIDGELLGISLFGVGGLLWFFVPVWDRETETGRRSRLVNYAGIFVVFFIVVMTIVGHLLS